MGINGTVHGKDRVGSNFFSAVFLRVPADEVIAIVGRSRQACQFSSHSHGAGWVYAAAVGIKDYGVGVGRLVLCQEKVQIKYAFFRLAYPAKASAFSSNAA